MKLKQKQGTRSREFELIGNKLHVKTKSMGERNEYTIDVEYIGHERFLKTYSRVGPIIIGLLFYAFMVIIIVATFFDGNWEEGYTYGTLIMGILVGGGIGTLAFFAKMRNESHLVGGSTQVMFLLNSPSQEEMEAFIEKIVRRSRIALLEKYTKVDPDLPEDIQMNNIYWLKERGLIPTEEYEDLKQEYKNQRLMR